MPLDCAQELVWRADSQLSCGAQRVAEAKLKRLLDIVGALVGLIVLGPFLLLLSVLIRLESSGPALFRQKRSGYDGRTFVIYKFRTMAVAEDGPMVAQATRQDCRATRLG